jgi:hypothetical protein
MCASDSEADKIQAPTAALHTLVLTWIAMFACLLMGLGGTADCVNQERREGTLGLLFLTNLRRYDVVLGGLASTGLNSFCWHLPLPIEERALARHAQRNAQRLAHIRSENPQVQRRATD